MLISLGAWAVWKNQGGQDPAERWRLDTADRGDVVQVITANGNLNPVTSVSVGTQVSGTILRLHADFNSEVKQGQLLAELDPSLFNAAVASSSANLNSASAALRLAETKEARTRALVGKGFISQAELDVNVQELDAARAQVEVAKAQVSRDKTNLGYATIRSPISGVVVARTVEVGQTVAASFSTPTLFTIAKDLKEMQIETSIAEADVGGLKEGQPARFRVDAFPGQFFRGQVRQVRLSPTIQSNVVTYTVIVTADNPEGHLKPGMTAYVQITANRKQGVLRVTNAALRFRPATPEPGKDAPREPVKEGEKPAAAPGKGGGGAPGSGGRGARGGGGQATQQRVYKLVDGKPVAVPVKTGLSDANFTEIVEGDIKEGDKLVTRDLVAQGTAGPAAQPRMRMF
ncbi:efflux RND transporter periplasmic adaptor subunit [Usitatibacter palustris]|uniref:efflux RND transporter periplasmic adaptor subunit n=1 Tax=Usitatibacter palustris TaxID=2732487 RepID=UPI001FE9A630|nr:efflux RND transporter periplasmic adaptor subunit [Usitatibacter palustris]